MSAPSTGALLTQWDWEPSVIIGIILFGAAYAYVVGPLRRRLGAGPPVGRSRVTWFVLSELVLVISLLSPLDTISDEFLFSAHMVQHLFLAAVWPPLVLAAMPGWLVRPVFRHPALGPIASFLTYPAAGLILFNFDVYLWHLPALYNATLQHLPIHILEHLTFMAFGILNWWPVLSPAEEQRLTYPLQVLYLFLDGMLMMVLGIVFTFSPVVFYTAYDSAPRLWGISLGADQQIGGLIMWYPGNLPYAVYMVIAFYRWFEGDEESQALAPPSPTIGSRLP